MNAVTKTAGKLTQIGLRVSEPLFYYSRVSFSFVKQVAHHSKLTSLNVSNGIQGLSNFSSSLTTSRWKTVTVNQIRELLFAAVKIGGFFLVGEMIGRQSIVGYNVGETKAHH